MLIKNGQQIRFEALGIILLNGELKTNSELYPVYFYSIYYNNKYRHSKYANIFQSWIFFQYYWKDIVEYIDIWIDTWDKEMWFYFLCK